MFAGNLQSDIERRIVTNTDTINTGQIRRGSSKARTINGNQIVMEPFMINRLHIRHPLQAQKAKDEEHRQNIDSDETAKSHRNHQKKNT